MRTREDFITLIASLEGDFSLLEEILSDNTRALARMAHGADDSLDLGAWGYTLHGVYNLLENYFLRISKFFENPLPTEAWHQVLLERMKLDLAPLRPPLVESKELFEALEELRGFRHVFRHNYGSRLKREKLAIVQNALDRIVREFPQAHRNFVGKLKSLSAGLE